MDETENVYNEYNIFNFRIGLLDKRFWRNRNPAWAYIQIWKQKPVGMFRLIWRSI